MQYFIIAVAALVTSGLTLFSGFGLGTLLLPVFAVFFPVETAIVITAIVHLLNNIFKFILLGKFSDWGVVIRFGMPAILAAFLGAKILLWFAELAPLAHYTLGGHVFLITPIKVVIAVLMTIFALLEILPQLDHLTLDKKYLPAGGVLSGFFGGLSGHQGALRSAFLLKCGLTKETFIATGVAISCIVDITRIFVYSSRFAVEFSQKNTYLLITAIAAAFTGVFIGSRLIKKITMRTVRLLVSILLFGIALALGSGWI
ncbi:MAG: TSUP family transporter [bacterium]